MDFDPFLLNRFLSCCLCVFLFMHSFRSSLPGVKFTTQFSEKRLRSLSEQQYISEFELPFWVITIEITWNSFCVVLSKPKSVNHSAKANDGAIGTIPSQRPFQGFLWNSRGNNIQALATPHTGGIYWWVKFLRSFSVSMIYFLNQPTAP